MAELALAQARTQANIDRLSREFNARDQAMREETARRDAEFHAEMGAMRARADKAAADHRKEMGELSRKMGTLTEDIVAPGIPDVFRERFHVEVEECLVRRGRSPPFVRTRASCRRPSVAGSWCSASPAA